MRDVPGSKPDHCDLQESIKLNLLSDPVPQYHSKCVAWVVHISLSTPVQYKAIHFLWELSIQLINKNTLLLIMTASDNRNESIV